MASVESVETCAKLGPPRWKANQAAAGQNWSSTHTGAPTGEILLAAGRWPHSKFILFYYYSMNNAFKTCFCDDAHRRDVGTVMTIL